MFKKLMENIMAKNKKKFLQEIATVGEEEIVEIAKKVAEEEIEPFEVEEDPTDIGPWNPTLEVPEDEGKMDKQKFLDSIGMGERPGSQLAATKWKEYLGI